MKKRTSDRTLESFKIFPYLAWGVTLFFSYFVFTIIVDLQQTVQQLQTVTQSLETKVAVPVDQIQDFDR